VHCANEPFQERTRRCSSQLVGDDTAHTVRTKLIGFMPRIPELVHWANSMINYAIARKLIGKPRVPGGEADFVLVLPDVLSSQRIRERP
jgi:hypothetical protein